MADMNSFINVNISNDFENLIGDIIYFSWAKKRNVFQIIKIGPTLYDPYTFMPSRCIYFLLYKKSKTELFYLNSKDLLDTSISTQKQKKIRCVLIEKIHKNFLKAKLYNIID